MKEPKLLVLLKFGNKEVIKNLLEKGKIKLKRLKQYMEIEDKVRQDKNEGINLYSQNSNFLKLELNGQQLNYKNL